MLGGIWMILKTDQATKIKYSRNTRLIPVSNSMDDIQAGYKFSLIIKKYFSVLFLTWIRSLKSIERPKGYQFNPICLNHKIVINNASDKWEM